MFRMKPTKSKTKITNCLIFCAVCVRVCVYSCDFFIASRSLHHITFVCTFLCVLLLIFSLSLSQWLAFRNLNSVQATNKQTSNGSCLSFTGPFNAYYTLLSSQPIRNHFFSSRFFSNSFSILIFRHKKTTQIFYQCHTYGLGFYNKQNTNFNENNFSTGPIYN